MFRWNDAILLDRCSFRVHEIAVYLLQTNRSDMVKVILEHPTIMARSREDWFLLVIQATFIGASEKGSIGVVKELVGRCIPEVLKIAASNQQLEVVKLLLEVASENQLDLGASIGLAAEEAVSSRCIDMIKLLAAKCGIFETKNALEIATANNDLTMVVLLLDHSNQTTIEQGRYSFLLRGDDRAVLAAVQSCHTLASLRARN